MNWAVRRKVLIISLIASVLIAIAAATTFAIVYETPTCTDGKQNDDETGIDCGGSCAYQCLVDMERPVVRFARAFSPQPERYDVIAYIDNREATLEVKGMHVTAEIYDINRVLLETRKTIVDLPAGGTAPIYIPEAYRGGAPVGQVFIEIDDASLKFYAPKKKPVVPVVTNIETQNTDAPRIRATLMNPTAFPIYDVRPVATVFDQAGNAIAASQTLVTMIGGQGEAQALFVWNVPFIEPPARVEVLPVVPLQGP